MAFLSACESSLGEFESKQPHTGFVLMFLAMCASGGACVLNILTVDAAIEMPGRNKSTQEMISNEEKSNAMVDKKIGDGNSVVDEDSVMKSPGEQEIYELREREDSSICAETEL